MLQVTDLPAVNATLNGIAATFLTVGWVFIRRRNIAAHRACMWAAFAMSTLFLISYIIYHANVGSVRFTGQGPIRIFYFTVLISHIILAVAILPLALVTLWRALAKQFARHAMIARWTLPVWLYVSVTGVMVYVMLYHL